MKRTGNYEIQKRNAQDYFLRYDQEDLIIKFSMLYDDTYLYTDFVGRSYRIHRKTGNMEWSTDKFQTVAEADFEEVLSVFDLLCYGKEDPTPSGEWALVNSLPGTPRTVGVETGVWSNNARIFVRNSEKFRKACEKLGGRPVNYGDIGYEIPVFRKLSVILKLYEEDEEFPAQLSVLWDKKSMEYLHYETTFYVVEHLIKTIKKYVAE